MEITFKYIGLPIPDLDIGYEIDHDKRVIAINLDDHLDSALLIGFLRRLEQGEHIRIVDNESFKGKPANIPGRFKVELTLADQLFDAVIVEMAPKSAGAPPEFTLCMEKMKARDE